MRIAVLGVGLIGGSIGLAARGRAQAEVCGYDPDPRVRERALARGVLDSGTGDLAAAVERAEAVFVAAPVGALPGTVAEALAAAPPDCVVSDVGSAKRLLSAATADERFIGGHPLAGAETEGVEHARADLFEGATWYLTPERESTAGVLYERLHALLRSFGAHPVAIDAATHDRMMADVSHLPHVLANLLAAQAAGLLGEERERLPAVGPSLRDSIRVAGANPPMWRDIYAANADAVIAAIDELASGLSEVRGMLARAEGEELQSWIERSLEQRDALLGTGHAPAALHELRAHVPNRPGVIAEIALALGGASVNIADLALSPSRDNSQGVVALWIAGDAQAARAERLVADLGFPVVRA